MSDTTSLGTAQLIRLTDVKAERVTWLWERRIPLGKLSIVDGDPGLGKSTMSMDIAARVSRGASMPDGSLSDLAGPRGVVLLSAEDGLGDTIRPRLEAAGAALDLIVALDAIVDEEGLEANPEIPLDVAHIEDAILTVRAALVIIDPLMAYLGSDTNSYRDQDVRRALSPLKGVAERTGAAIVLIRHLTKAVGGSPLYRGGGSIGIIGAVRSGLLVAADPDDETGERRILASTKSNLGPPPPALAYRLVTAGDTSRVQWEEETAHTASQLLAIPATEEGRSARSEAIDFLNDLLADGPVTAKDVQKQAREAGIADATLRRAKTDLQVEARREGGLGTEGLWIWVMPKMLTNPLRQSPKSVSTLSALGGDEHLNGHRETRWCATPGCLQAVPIGDHCPKCAAVVPA